MPIIESFLCGLTLFIYIESIRNCFQRRHERHYNSQEIVPILVQPRINPSSFELYDIQSFAPLSNDIVSEDDICPICFDKLSIIRYRRKTICGHTFCSECIQEWFHKKRNCPMCMKPFEEFM